MVRVFVKCGCDVACVCEMRVFVKRGYDGPRVFVKRGYDDACVC